MRRPISCVIQGRQDSHTGIFHFLRNTNRPSTGPLSPTDSWQMLVSLYKAAKLASSFFSTSLHILSAQCRQHPVPASCPHQLLSQLAPTTYVCSSCSHTTRDWAYQVSTLQTCRSSSCSELLLHLWVLCAHAMACVAIYGQVSGSGFSTMGSIWVLNSGCHAYVVSAFSYWSILLDTCWLWGVF